MITLYRYLLSITVGMLATLSVSAQSPSTTTTDSTDSLSSTNKTSTLDELVIEAKWMYPKDGNLVVNVSAIPQIKHLSTDEMLRRIPGLTKSSKGAYSLDGKKVVVYINGIRQAISSSSLEAFLSSLPASAIASVELVSTNTGKYEAGVDAAIDIKTHRNVPLGYSLQPSLFGSTLTDRLGTGGGNLFYMVKLNRLLLHSSLGYTNDWIYDRDRDSLFLGKQQIIANERTRSGRIHQLIYQGAMSYQLPSGSSLSLNAFVYYDDVRSRTPWRSTQASGLDRGKGNSDYYNLALSYQTPYTHKAFYGKLAYSVGYGGQYTHTRYLNPAEQLQHLRRIDMDGWMNTLTGDFNSQFESWHLSYGVRVDRNSIEQVSHYEHSQSPRTNSHQPFKGSELLTALYAQANYRFSQRFSLRLGSRLEHTHYRYELGTIEPKLSYLNVFPSLVAYYNRPNYNLALGLVSGITRPHYQWMLPGEQRINDFLYSVGKPEIAPLHRYSLILNNTLFGYAKLNLSYVWEQGVTGSIYTQRGERLYHSIDNIGDNRSIRAYIALPFAFWGRKLMGQMQGNYQYNRLVNLRNGFTVPTGRETSYFTQRYSAYVSYTPIERLGFSVEGVLRPAQSTTLTSMPLYTSWEARLSYDFLRERNLTLTVSALNLGRTTSATTTYFLGNSYRISSLSPGPEFRVSLKFRLNKGQRVTEEYRDYRPSTSRLM